MRRVLSLRTACALGAAALGLSASAHLLERLAPTWFLPEGGSRRHAGEPAAVLVLGHADPARSPGRVNRSRAASAVAVLRPGDLLVASGAAVLGPVSEARLLARAARRAGWQGPIILEERSRTTRGNLREAAALVPETGPVLIVSDPVHAARARALARRHHPGLARRLVGLPGGAHAPSTVGRTLLGALQLLGLQGAAVLARGRLSGPDDPQARLR